MSCNVSYANTFIAYTGLEDILNRFPARDLRVEFTSGPELSQEQIYALFRPYGRIKSLEPPNPKDTPKIVNVSYTNVRSAAAARNSLYGYKADPEHTGTPTALRILYKERRKYVQTLRIHIMSSVEPC